MKRVVVVGAGFSGAAIARTLADSGAVEVLVLDEREHVGGNCYTRRDPATGVLVHQYGPHIFHTSRPEVWAWVNRFATLRPFVNRVKAVTARGVFSLPLNLLTLNQFFGRRMNPAEATTFLSGLGDRSIREPRNFEEKALSLIGRELYEAFFAGYTRKQWGVDPRELPASILQRVAIRTSYDDNYFSDPYQAMPEEGYTGLIERALDHPKIRVELGRRATPGLDAEHLFWTGPIDAYYGHHLGRLRYRTLDFEWIRADGDYQGNAVLNWCEPEVPWTRVTEHKHFMPHEAHAGTIVCREYSRAKEPGDIAYYPLGLDQDKALLAAYQALAAREEGVTFAGRLGRYRYLDMEACIAEALDAARGFLARRGENTP